MCNIQKWYVDFNLIVCLNCYREFLENEGPICMESKKKSITAQQFIQEVMSAAEAVQSEHEDGSEKGEESQKSTILQKYSPQLVKMILELLCDESVSVKVVSW